MLTCYEVNTILRVYPKESEMWHVTLGIRFIGSQGYSPVPRAFHVETTLNSEFLKPYMSWRASCISTTSQAITKGQPTLAPPASEMTPDEMLQYVATCSTQVQARGMQLKDVAKELATRVANLRDMPNDVESRIRVGGACMGIVSFELLLLMSYFFL